MTTAPQYDTEAPFCVVTDGSLFAVSMGDGTYAPITRYGTPRHRANVSVDEISDLACMGLPGGEYDVQLAAPRYVGKPRVTAVGTCSPAMRARIVTALARESTARGYESKYRIPFGFAAVAGETARMAPGTRRIGSHPN